MARVKVVLWVGVDCLLILVIKRSQAHSVGESCLSWREPSMMVTV